MKSNRWLSLITAGLLMSAVVHAEQILSAHYEINVEDQGATNTVRSTFRLKPGGREVLELHPHTVQLSVVPVSDQEYDLNVAVLPKGKQPAAALLNQKFRGRYGVPLELDGRNGSVHVNGAISVVVLERKGA